MIFFHVVTSRLKFGFLNSLQMRVNTADWTKGLDAGFSAGLPEL